MSLMWISIILVVAGILFLLIELVVPGGVIGVIGALLMVAGVICGFVANPILGMFLLIGSLVCSLAAFWLWTRFFPDSSMGKKIFLQDDAKDWHGFDETKKELVGKRGMTMTPLMPSGAMKIENDRIDVVSEGDMIEKGVSVEVIAVEGNRVVVARVEDEQESA